MSVELPIGGSPAITNHAHERYRQRARPTAPPVRRAWKDGVTDDRLDDRVDGDEIRYHAPSETVLVRRDHCITTVLDADRLHCAVIHELREVHS